VIVHFGDIDGIADYHIMQGCHK